MTSDTFSYNDDTAYQQARRRVMKLKGFYSHLISFVFVNTGLILINLLTSPSHLWFFWPLLGWGVGIISHAAGVFNWFNLYPKDWEERKIREYMEKSQPKNRL